MTALLCVLLAGWTTIAAQSRLPARHYKYQATLRVCQSVAAAYGNHRLMPQLVMVASTNPDGIIARFVPKPVPQVWIDEKLYDICSALGKDSLNALAYVAGHELSHYYRGHDWTENFVSVRSNLPAESNPAGWKAAAEAEADRDGAFYAYAAGYQPYSVATTLFETIYRTYHLPETMPGYPSRPERIDLVARQAEEARQYAYLLEVGRFLWLKKEFDAAEQCFAAVVANFPAKEAWNNLGACQLAQAADRLGNEEMYFAYPFEIDASNRLLNGSSRGEQAGEGPNQVRPLLEKAIHSFEKARLLDSVYVPAYVNWACAETLQGNHALAVGLIDKLDGYQSQPLPGNAYLIRGIARVRMGRVEEAEADFQLMKQQQAHQAAYNYALFEKISRTWLDYLPDWATHWPAVQGWIQQYFMAAPAKIQSPVKVESLPAWLVGGKTISGNTFKEITRLPHPAPLRVALCTIGNVTGFIIESKTRRMYLAQACAGGSCRSDRGLRPGDSVKRLVNRYGSPSRTVAGAANTVFYVYDQAGLIAEVIGGRVKGWMVYQISPL
jgi:tetratricopeptide (TPR) repeat protein